MNASTGSCHKQFIFLQKQVKGQGHGHQVINFSTHGKVSSQAIHMSNMKALHQRVQKLWPMLKFCDSTKVSQRSRSRSPGHKFKYTRKGLITSNTHVKYESPKSKGSKFIDDVKVLCFYKSRSKFKVKVTGSYILVCIERSRHKQHTCQI